jgi:hypothetical protein
MVVESKVKPSLLRSVKKIYHRERKEKWLKQSEFRPITGCRALGEGFRHRRTYNLSIYLACGVGVILCMCDGGVDKFHI